MIFADSIFDIINNVSRFFILLELCIFLRRVDPSGKLRRLLGQRICHSVPIKSMTLADDHVET
jgi:hypothetical protein